MEKNMRLMSFAALLGCLSGISAPLYGQSLADVAKREEERRKSVKDTGKVYTNNDLRPVPQPEPPPPAAASSDTKEPNAEAAKEPRSETKDQAYWFSRISGLREQLDRDQLHAEAVQSRINGLTADFAARDDPAQRAQIGLAREKAIAELERLKIAIEEGTQAIEDLDEEARRASVPPGWLR
jgi:hypothetical protein